MRMVIELVGVSGAGKTAIAVELLRRRPTIQAGRRSLALLGGRSAFPCLPLEALGVGYSGFALARILGGSRILRWAWARARTRKRFAMLRLLARTFAARTLPLTYLLDQGVVQSLVYLTRSWQPDLRQPLVEELLRLIGDAGLPDVVVHVTAAPERARMRTKMANVIHHDPAEIDRIRACIAVHLSALTSKRLRVVTATNDGDLDSCVAGLLAQPPFAFHGD